MSGPNQVGVVVGGSLTKSLEVRLDPGASAALGHYVMAPLDGGAQLLGMVTDIVLRSAEAGSVSWPPPAGDDPASALLREVLQDTGVYTAVEVTPYLEVDLTGGDNARARRLPRHFAPVALADQETIDAAFAVDEKASINLGTPLGMDRVEVCVDIEKLFERSAGVFGKSGTGKTVIAVEMLDARVQHSANRPTSADRTVALVFDMHDDYGQRIKFEGGERASLKGLHPQDVAVYSLERNAINVERRIEIGTRDIKPEDLDVLRDVTSLTAPGVEASHECEARLGIDWVDEITQPVPSAAVVRRLWGDEDAPEDVNWARVASRMGVHPGSFDNLRRGLRSLVRREFVRSGESQVNDVINHVVKTLQGGKSVVVQFGRHGNDLTSYMLVANMLSRRIWEEYREAKEQAQGNRTKEPNRLVIVIEEAHKFVDRALAGQSIFGQIARELRKYNVTLFVIDQRPSQIDSEVLSQIGTKFCFQLDSDADVDALVGGVAGRAALRQVIASLESRQQALVFGHALPMPVIVRPPDLPAVRTPGASLRDRLQQQRPAGAPSPAGLFG